MAHGFRYKNIEELYSDCEHSGYALPKPGAVEVLSRRVTAGGLDLKNAFVAQPMEGCDSDRGGAPTELTVRRYRRFAQGGAGLIWVEAVAISPESRANPAQLMITEQNLEQFKNLIDEIHEAAQSAGQEPPKVIAQLTHSGRWSRPVDKNAPIRVSYNTVLDEKQELGKDYPIASDDYLRNMAAQFAHSTELCRKAGFDGVDVKACHLYLVSEILSAQDREGLYGGSYENRTRLLKEGVAAAKEALDGGVLSVRINLYDGEAAFWGVGADGRPCYDEPVRLLKELYEMGVTVFNLTMGTPYFNPHVNRPDLSGGGSDEKAVVGVARLLEGCKAAQQAVPDALCVATGFSYLRQFAPQIAAGLIEEGGAKAVGFGREMFAYPDFVKDVIETGEMDKSKICLTCGLCTKVMRAGGVVGCPVRDKEIYLTELKRVTAE